MVLSDSVTAREAHLCGERGSPAAGKGVVCLRTGLWIATAENVFFL